MKKLSLFIAFAVLAALTMVSCNNKPQEPTQEEVQEMKQALADSVLAEIDAFADEYIIADENRFHLKDFELTEKEKQVKPDYLLDPAEANNFVTKSQKVNALAFYVVDMGIRKLYDMPIDETREAIAKLALDINYPFDIDAYEAKISTSECLKTEYEKCKENGDLASFWQYHNAMIVETGYVITQNPDLFSSRISEEQWQYFRQMRKARNEALKTLAQYDEEIASVLELRNKNTIFSSDEEREKANSSVEASKQFRIANKDKFIARRNAMLQ